MPTSARRDDTSKSQAAKPEQYPEIQRPTATATTARARWRWWSGWGIHLQRGRARSALGIWVFRTDRDRRATGLTGCERRRGGASVDSRPATAAKADGGVGKQRRVAADGTRGQRPSTGHHKRDGAGRSPFGDRLTSTSGDLDGGWCWLGNRYSERRTRRALAI